MNLDLLAPHTPQDETVVLWGSGSPRRELLHVDDMALACLQLTNRPDVKEDALFTVTRVPIVNIGTGTDQTIAELAETVRRALDADVRVEWDRSKPDGTPGSFATRAACSRPGGARRSSWRRVFAH